ncbi:MAG: alkaline phosphatase family protein [Patescibacteria group bacterium]
MTENTNHKVVVIGLDGGTFKLLKPLAEEGLMPNFKKLLDKGSHSILWSTMPPMTGTAWSSFATGKTPGKHTVYDFLLPDEDLSKFHITSCKDIKGKTLPEIIYENSKHPITVNMPNSWPPRLGNTGEVVITSILTQGDQWIWPEGLEKEIPELKDYQLTPNESLRLKGAKDSYADEVLDLVDKQMACVQKLFKQKPWDFFFYLFSSTDWIQHASYDELLENRAESPLRIYKQVDKYLGWFIENLPENADLMIMSDHGFKSFKKTFFFNKWLEKEGYLKTKSTGDDFKEAVTRRAKETEKVRAKKKKFSIGKPIFDLMEKMPWLEKPAKNVYHKVVKKYLPVNVKVDIGIDYDNTKCCFPKGSYMTNAYINDTKKFKNGIVKTDEEYNQIRDEIIDKIKNLKGPDGDPVVADVFTKEQIYGEDTATMCPDLFFKHADYWLDGQFHTGKLFEKGVVSNKHDFDGVFIAYGPSFKEGHEIKQKIGIKDIAPNILHLMDVPVPKDMDGKIIDEIYKNSKEVKYQNDKDQLSSLVADIEI